MGKQSRRKSAGTPIAVPVIAEVVSAVHSPASQQDHGRFLWCFFAFTVISVMAGACVDRPSQKFPKDLGPPPVVASAKPIPPAAQQALNQSFAAYRAGLEIGACLDPTKHKACPPGADQALEIRNWQIVVEKATEAIALAPDYAESYNNRASGEIMLGNYDVAIEDAQHAITLKPGVPLFVNNLAWAKSEKAKKR